MTRQKIALDLLSYSFRNIVNLNLRSLCLLFEFLKSAEDYCIVTKIKFIRY